MGEYETKGFTKINNDILETLAITELNGRQRRIIDVIIRNTYGYQRSCYEMSLTYLSKATRIYQSHISVELKKLIDRKIVVCYQNSTFNKPQVLGINENVNQWVLPKTVTLTENSNAHKKERVTVTKNSNRTITKNGKGTVTKNGNTTITEIGNQKRKNKENIKESVKKDSSIYSNTYIEVGGTAQDDNTHTPALSDTECESNHEYYDITENDIKF